MHTRTRLLLGTTLGAAMFACQDVPVRDAGTDAGPIDTPPIDAPPTDAPPVVDSGTTNNPLTVTFPGCGYSVHTTPASYANVMGDDSTFGTDPTPRAVHVDWAADPSSTAAVVWDTRDDTLATVVEYGTSPTALSQRAVGLKSSGGSASGRVNVHEVHLCGLTPNTTYYYHAGGEGHYGDVQSFKTAPAAGQADYDINFAVSGDSRDDATVWQQVQQAVLSTDAMHVPDFQLFSGDAVALGQVQGAWDTWFDHCTSAMARMPVVMAHGNHDALAINYLMQFAQPQSAASVQDELYFSLEYGPIHLVVLNDSPPNGDIAGVVGGVMKQWLVADLAAVDRARTPWVIVMHHKPAFSASTHSQDADTTQIRAILPPVFYANQVDVVFNGHDHDFEITKPLDSAGNPVPQGSYGTAYVTAAGAGASLYPSHTQPWTRYSESVVNFVLVHVTKHTLDLRAYRVDGTEISQARTSLTH